MDVTREHGLTRRQVDVLRLLADGLLNKQIAWELEMSENTVRAHVKAIYRALGVTNRVLAVRRAYQLGIVTVRRIA